MTEKCLNCHLDEVFLVSDDFSDGTSIHHQVYQCGSCGAKIFVAIPGQVKA